MSKKDEQHVIKRRNFLAMLGGALYSSVQAGIPTKRVLAATSSGNHKRIIFQARSKVGIINEDGNSLKFFDFDIPDQVSWHAGPFFSDGRRIILTSYEKGKSWEGKVRTHLWIYDLYSKSLTSIAEKNRPSPFLVCSVILPGEKRIITGPIIDGEQRVFIMNLDGTDQVQVTKQGDGFTYGVSLSPDAARLAFHATGNEGYRIFVTNLDGSNRKMIAGHPDHLYFGTSWSPDGEWILYHDCHHRNDPGHERSDLCIGRPDGSDHRVITHGQSHWLGTSYGNPETRGSGSNMPQWSPDGSVITYTRARPGSRTAWQYQPQRPDTDHFNRDYMPEQAMGGTQLCLLNPFSGIAAPITKYEEHKWDFRTEWSPDGKRILFCRAMVGEPSEIWIMDANGEKQRFLTRGENDMGVDHPRFLPGHNL